MTHSSFSICKAAKDWVSIDSFKIGPYANKAGVGNKLVTIFARHRDNFIVTQNISLICQFRDFRLWTNPATVTTLSFAGTGKNCAIVACPPGLILPKVPGHVTADGATNAYYLHQPAVSIQAITWGQITGALTNPGLKQLAQMLTENHNFTQLPGLKILCNFISDSIHI